MMCHAATLWAYPLLPVLLCAHVQGDVPIEPRQFAEFDCNKGYHNFRVDWSISQKEWCCQHKGKACSAKRRRLQGTVYDCDLEADGWEVFWSKDKKDWCCKQAGKGCVTYDCETGSYTAWSDEQKNWCCQQKGKPCPAKVAYDCDAGFSAWRARWSKRKKSWCCRHGGRGCTKPKWILPGQTFRMTSAPPASLEFDCNAGFANWEVGWSVAKMDWCCQHVGRACSATLTNVPHPTTLTNVPDCQIGVSTWEIGWSDDKKKWCCLHVGIACPATTPVVSMVQIPIATPEYDCNVDYANWQVGWSNTKMEWCCQNTNRGCTTAPKLEAKFEKRSAQVMATLTTAPTALFATFALVGVVAASFVAACRSTSSCRNTHECPDKICDKASKQTCPLLDE